MCVNNLVYRVAKIMLIYRVAALGHYQPFIILPADRPLSAKSRRSATRAAHY